MSGRYAEGTGVAVESSQAEISRILTRYGCDGMMFGEANGDAVVLFRARDRNIRFTLRLPTPADQDMVLTPKRVKRTAVQVAAAVAAERKRRWRCLALAIKSKLETVATGIETFEEAFAMHTVMPDGRVMSEHVMPAMNAAIASGEMPRALLTTGER